MEAIAYFILLLSNVKNKWNQTLRRKILGIKINRHGPIFCCFLCMFVAAIVLQKFIKFNKIPFVRSDGNRFLVETVPTAWEREANQFFNLILMYRISHTFVQYPIYSSSYSVHRTIEYMWSLEMIVTLVFRLISGTSWIICTISRNLVYWNILHELLPFAERSERSIPLNGILNTYLPRVQPNSCHIYVLQRLHSVYDYS